MGEPRPRLSARRRRPIRRALSGGLLVAVTALSSSCGVLPALGPALPPEAAGATSAPLAIPGSTNDSSASSTTPVPSTTGVADGRYDPITADQATINLWESSVLRIRSVTCTGTYTGSGFVVDAHTIVTNQHVVRGATQIQVDTVDGRDIAVKDVSQASDIDLAVIHTDATLPHPLPVVGADVQGGEKVAVIGYPLGGPIVTSMGSVKGWFLDQQLKGGLALRTDAAVDHGNSGGPVLDRTGAVVGIVYAKFDDGWGSAIAASVLRAHLADSAGFATKVTCDTP